MKLTTGENVKLNDDMDAEAIEVARRNNVSLNSLGFFYALDREIIKNESARFEWNSFPVRFEEWSANREAGLSDKDYYDDLASVNNRFAARHVLLESIRNVWIKKYPELYEQYKQGKTNYER